MTAYEPGTPSWVDVSAPDTAAAAAFYGRVFGWELEDMGPDAGGYGMFKLNGKYVAGIGPVQDPNQPPSWSTYVSTDDVDAAVDRVKASGGMAFVEPMDVFDSGRMAFAADPTGAVFGLWQPRQHIGAQLVNEPGALCWNELMTRDTSAAAEFYEKLFGWKADASSAEGGMEYYEFKLNDRSVAGMMPIGADFPAEMPNNWLTYFAVADCDATVTEVQAAGGNVVNPAMDISVGRFAMVSDLAGAPFAVIQLAQ
jgi:hypothetical protein